MHRYLMICVFCLCVHRVSAQNIPALGANRVRISDTDRSIVFDVEPVDDDINTDPQLTYYWYSTNKIHTTQGGYSGKLLNGSYTEYYQNKNLKEQGSFKDGLKNGVWKEWSEGGLLVQSTTWVNGTPSGDFSKFDANGVLKQHGTYQKGILNGKLYNYYPKDSVEVLYYKNGQPVKKGRPLLKRLFSHKKHQPDSVKVVKP